MSPIDFRSFDALTFDCYGTLIDWETGILHALQPVLAPRGVEAAPDDLLERYARHEAALEAGDYLTYREVVARSLAGLAGDYGFAPSEDEMQEFAAAVAAWPAFSDSASALRRLADRFALGVITNCDDDLFAHSNRRLGVTFTWVVTAQQVGSYKPNPRNFAAALQTMDLPVDRVLHVAQSLYHDHAPAQQAGLTTVWVDRRHDKPGFGATPPAAATPDLTVTDMRTFADVALRM